MDNFSTELLRLFHEPIDLYPVRVIGILPPRKNYGELRNVDGLKAALKEIFQDSKTGKLLLSLLSQIADVKPRPADFGKEMAERVGL